MANKPCRLKVVVAVLTLSRPEELRRFLAAYPRLERPADTDVLLLVIDNDQRGSARPIFEAAADRLGEVVYTVEGRRGIPMARNRALDEAAARGADLLCFVDDDEIPEPGWLVALVDAFRRTACHLIGGPVRVQRTDAGLGWWQHYLEGALADRAGRKERRTAAAASRGARFTIVTNNWAGDVRWLQAHGVRFDEDYRFSGGSDTRFFRSALATGARVGWSPDAVVREVIAPERLSIAYQFRRSRAQSINHFVMKHERITPGLVASTVAAALYRFVTGLFVLIVPVYGRSSPLVGVHAFGWATGRLGALAGWRSRLYE